MKSVEIIRACAINAQHREVGDVLELDDHEAQRLVWMARAKFVQPTLHDEFENMEAVLDTDSAAAIVAEKKRGRPRKS